ncbi:MAG: shikimate kinase AroK [Acidobacteriaceae bacterium]
MNTLSIDAAGETPSRIPAVLSSQVSRIVLTGFMGAGKSTVGRLLAAQLGWTFLDLDAHLEARAGATVPQLFETLGEPGFRRLESSALANALRQSRLVLALGGGAPETLTNRLLLEQTPGTLTVLLDAPFASLFDRCMLQALNPGEGDAARDANRPNLRDAESARARFNLRQPLYRRLARVIVDTVALTPAQTVPAVLSAIENLG